MKELIFSISEIFDSVSPSGALSQYECSRYHIPAYQRGYKWGADASGAVTLLLEDLWKAFTEGKEEYYLQYITSYFFEKIPILCNKI